MRIEKLEESKSEDEKMICCICGKEIPVEHGNWTEGHNAQPVKDGSCCKHCNDTVVLPARLERSR